MLTQYPKIGRTTDFIDPLTGKIRPGQITAVNGDGTVNIRGASGRNYANMLGEGRRRYGSRRPNLLSLDQAEFTVGTIPAIYQAASGNSALSIESTTPLDGVNSLRCTVLGAPTVNDGIVMTIFIIQALPNAAYSLGLFIKQDVATAGALLQGQLIFRNSGGGAIGAATTTPDTCTTAPYVTCSGVSPVGTTNISIKAIYGTLPNTGDTFIIDKICVRQGTDPTYIKPIVIS